MRLAVIPSACRCDPQELRELLEDTLPPGRQSELIRHLDGCPACQQTLERYAADDAWWAELHHLRSHLRAAAPETEGPTVEEPLSLDFLDAPAEPDQLGRLGPFVVTEVLGRGGMGIVLKAFDPGLHRPVAIKVLAPYFASSAAARRRFAREARAAAAVVHEHVVPIYSVEVWKGLPYLVMACVAGHSLQERLSTDGPLEVREILRIGMQAASGLAAAHAQGLVHRDIKPANILLEDGVERVLLTDFGLARAADDASLTQSGVIAGTPPYMAPEQARGQAVDHRADLFSLGSTLYAMCTGHAPFRADSAMAVLRRVCDEQPRPIRESNPDIPAWLEALIARLHAKDPADRFPSAAAVAELLGRCLAHIEQPAANPLPAELAASAPPRRPFRLAGFALLLGAGVVAASASYLGSPEIQPSVKEPAAAQHSAPAGDDAKLDDRLRELRQRTLVLEADLRGRANEGNGDPAAVLVEDLRRRVERLDQQLTAPEKASTVRVSNK